MKMIAICNLKGGTGKTTSAIMIATGLTQLGRTVTVLDLDPQGSATEWAQAAEEFGASLPFLVIPGNAHSIRRAPQSDFVLLDCPPGNAQIIDAAVASSDEVIIPVSPSGIEVDRMWDALDLTAEKPTRVLLAQVVLNTNNLASLQEALRNENVEVFPGVIPRREAIRNAYRRLPEKLWGYESVAAALVKESA
ncbi:hypothetical protein BRL53_05280 [Corynebacterium ulcerans]|uniref:ParA family protein n=1 Tax=Corynebacterium ulcerans TaxID=65058 RepID=UPI000C7759B2|nr:ParA family protein [Corynebacterium ulcerans]PLW00147.1 hypothetical protein BRL53_05280 [Corynebacterium ulcerans]